MRSYEQWYVRRIICDECGARAEVRTKDEVPEGWQETGGKSVANREAHCPHCVTQIAAEQPGLVFEALP